MNFLLGRSRPPGFELERTRSRLAHTVGREISLDLREVFVYDSIGEPGDRSRLNELLDAEALAPERLLGTLIILPRRGTRSPWASKAEDILCRCGLDWVRRVERGRWIHLDGDPLPESSWSLIHDPMTESVVTDPEQLAHWFDVPQPAPLRIIPLGDHPQAALAAVNEALGLALSQEEIDYLVAAYAELGRDPTDAELMMFAQANSEHCRHKIFNARWTIDGAPKAHSLFGMIRATHAAAPDGTLVAYHDNAAVIFGGERRLFAPDPESGLWRSTGTRVHTQIKVETHNHPTAISPHPGAGTGAGGEIRDESATGRGGRPVAALTGFAVGDLAIPGRAMPWEKAPPPPSRISPPLKIMLEGPIGAAQYNNEFGRPALCGYFRTLSAEIDGRWWGYYKPIMLAGGLGMISEAQVHKRTLQPGDHLIVLGGPAMLIGLGGGAASSVQAGQSSEALDFASVQRANPEMQRRCQEVIDRCWQLGERNPIASIHDVGAGGLSNAIPELLDDGGVGGTLELRRIPCDDPSMSPMAIWCNESQERYVLAVAEEDLPRFSAICARERCPMADLGHAVAVRHLRVDDECGDTPPVDLPLEVLLGKTPGLQIEARSEPPRIVDDGLTGIELDEAVRRVLSLPAVAAKHFLITIGDRTVGGLSVRDQMVGPWQVPVADCAVTLADYDGVAGNAMAVGERTPLAIRNAPASGRMAVAEALFNLAGVVTAGRRRIKLSANWMAAAGEPGQDAALYATVEAVALGLCRELGLGIPVGKDSLSMQMRWTDAQGVTRKMTAPVSLNVTAFAPVPDVRRHCVPMLDRARPGSVLVLLGPPTARLGASALAQVFGRELGDVPDVDEPGRLAGLFDLVQECVYAQRVHAVHDRSDGGLYTVVFEMALAGRAGVSLELPAGVDPVRWLFNEELGVVVQVEPEALEALLESAQGCGLKEWVQPVGRVDDGDRLKVFQDGRVIHDASIAELARIWHSTSHAMARLRDHPRCADEEHEKVCDWNDPGLVPKVGFEAAPVPAVGLARPRVAVLREQGVNGQREMAMAFHRAGFDAVDVHMSDLSEARVRLDDFHGLAVCGGFSFGDVLGAGRGWAKSILFNEMLAEQFQAFLADPGRFALGVCNGCQMLAALSELIPGTEHWPVFVHNRSRQFEARLSLVEVTESPSVFFSGMAGSRLPVVTAHGEGRASFDDEASVDRVPVALRYVDALGRPAERYPDNPNGSPAGITGLCNSDGRITIMMPHPERLLRAVNYSWAPEDWGDWSPWMRMFQNARTWMG
ncbi:MAG: phosphoribosylformylglycinamidine synthase [Wenzhouxiangellaceae bacterium]